MSHDNGPFRIGIAGFMGAGKSSCAALFAQNRSMRLVDADAEAKLLMENDGRLKDALVLAFGPEIVSRGVLDFAVLGQIAFSSTSGMEKLNGIVHPPLLRRLRDLVFSRAGPCVVDAALIPLWHIEDWFDWRLWVRAPSALRQSRVAARTGLSVEQIRQRMRVQETLMAEPTEANWFFVNNDGSLDDLSMRASGGISGRVSPDA
jgi:dephospho-CoA kinase